MADVGEGPITTPRADGYTPYDSSAGERTAAAGPWVKLPGGSVDGNGQLTHRGRLPRRPRPLETVLNEPLISVVTATWRRPRTVVEHAIPAVACQTYPNIEHLIVTDGFDPDLNQVLAKQGYATSGFHRRRVVLGRNWTQPFGNESNGAICRQVGSYVAAGEWIAYLDDDNDWDPSHLQKLYDTTLPEGSVDVVYSAFRYASGQVAGAAPPKVGHVDTSTFMHHWSALKHGSWLPDGYTCDGQFVERLVAAGCRWAFQTEPTVTLQGPNFGAPDA